MRKSMRWFSPMWTLFVRKLNLVILSYKHGFPYEKMC